MEVVAKSWAVAELVKQRRIYGKERVNLGYLTTSQIRSGLKDRDSLIRFIESELGYTANPVFYEAIDLGITPYLARRVSSWWLLSHYAGNLPFQIHLAQVSELTFNYCTSAMQSFHSHHPGYFLFIFTKDYSYVLFMATEWSLERIPKAGSPTWPFLPKPYPRFVLVNCQNPTESDASVLRRLKLHQSVASPPDMHARIIQALKLAERWEPFPEWFLPYWYRLRDPAQLQEALGDTEELLTQAEACLMECLASESLAKADEACEYLDGVIQLDDFDTLLAEEERHRLQLALRRIGDAQDFFESGEIDDGMIALQDTLFYINHARNAI